MDEFFWMLFIACVTIFTLRLLLAWGRAPLNRQAIRQLLLERLSVNDERVVVLREVDELMTVQIGDRVCDIHLDALHRRCAESPFRTLLFVRQAAEALQEALAESDALPVDWENRVLPLLIPADAALPADLLTRPFIPALNVGYVVDGEETFRWITQDDLARWAIDGDRLIALAMRNLERSCSGLVIESPPPLPDGKERILGFQTGDGLDAARILIASFYTRFSPRFDNADLCVAIPNRDSLVITTADDQAQITMLNWQATRDHSHHAYPLLNGLLKVSETGIELLNAENMPVEVEA